jgi:hypothetical protein
VGSGDTLPAGDARAARPPSTPEIDYGVRELVYRYAVAVDAQRWDLFDGLFTADVMADYTTKRWTSLAEWKTDFADFHAQFDGTQHWIGGVSWHQADGFVSAFSYVVARLVRRGAPGGDYAEAGAWYDDRVVDTDQGLRIGARVCRTMWVGGNTALLSGGRGTAPWHSLSAEGRSGTVTHLSTLPSGSQP